MNSTSFIFIINRIVWRVLALSFFALAVGWTGRAVAAQTSGLVAAYGFGEGNGSIVTDMSGNGNTGRIRGATWTAGRFDTALEFNGTGALVTVNDSDSLDLTTGMTLEAWVYPTSTAFLFKDVIYKGWEDIYYLEGSSPQLGAPATGGSFGGGPLYGTTALPVNMWSHLAGTYDGATIRLYVNGVQNASRELLGQIATSAEALTIGGDPLYGQYWTGRIDEVRIYNRALSVEEIQNDMNTPVGVPPPESTPPTVSITSPSSGSTVSHAITISATASDNVEVSAVEFFVDGTSLGTDVTNPYEVAWNTTTASNGVHTLTAVAKDTAGNQTTSAPVEVTTLNPAFANEVVVPGIVSATTIAFLPDGRMLVGELTETIWIVQAGANEPDPVPFLRIDNSGLIGEQGLMDITIDANYNQNGYYYVFYTRGFPGSDNRNRVSRFTASGNGTVPGSEVVLWQDNLTAQPEHHGGTVAFGPDGMIYISYGDQFVAEDAQRLDRYRGKILRINRDGSIPIDNPFFDGDGPNLDEIWALGLRNPFRMSFDLFTGRMYIGDVGGGGIEEVNLGIRGANYGWPLCEGDCSVEGTTLPIFSYPHNGRDACLTGGFVYRGSQFPSEYYGSYFFGDYVQNWIKRLTFDHSGIVTGVFNFEPANGSPDGPYGDPVDLVEGPDGSLYYVDLGFNDQHVPNEAAIRRIRYIITNQPPVAEASATPASGSPPLAVAFSSAGSFDPEGTALSYNWTFGDSNSSSEANPNHTYAAAGHYVARLAVSDGVNTTLSRDLHITAGNPPVATIQSPLDGTLFRAGDAITFSGSATDPEEGELPASAFSWTIVFHHEGHLHPGAGPIAGSKTGTFQIPTSGHDFSGATSYEFILSVTDSDGLKGTASVTIFPDKVNLWFETVPAGLAIELDGIWKVAPFTQDALIGFEHVISAPEQSMGGANYHFVSWSDGGAASHTIVVPANDQRYVATYARPGPLMAAYGFEEGSGATVSDASGNGNTGTINGATWTTGRFGAALEFNGIGALVTVNDSDSLDLTTGMTLEAWVYPTSTAFVFKDVIYKGWDDIYYLEGSSPQLGAPATGGNFGGGPLYGMTALPVNMWSHLTATYDGATIRLYVNGMQVASRAQTGLITTSTGALTIGGDPLYGQYWAGRIDEVRIYNRALSAGEIQNDMNRPVP